MTTIALCIVWVVVSSLLSGIGIWLISRSVFAKTLEHEKIAHEEAKQALLEEREKHMQAEKACRLAKQGLEWTSSISGHHAREAFSFRVKLEQKQDKLARLMKRIWLDPRDAQRVFYRSREKRKTSKGPKKCDSL